MGVQGWDIGCTEVYQNVNHGLGMELAIFVNSPIGKAGTTFLASVVTDAFKASLH